MTSTVDAKYDASANSLRRAEYWKAESMAANAEIERLQRTLAAVEHARDVEHMARRSLQQALKDLCAQHIGGEL